MEIGIQYFAGVYILSLYDANYVATLCYADLKANER
jgi:hypothetical protein